VIGRDDTCATTQQGERDTAEAEGLDRAVVVVGSGPTGMVPAAEPTLGGADIVILERRPGVDLDGARTRGLHARTSSCSTSAG
jgi:2-polyprenyl-6-methoxyphenol hydroxylase-like FAD-dependent oxidoreductase